MFICTCSVSPAHSPPSLCFGLSLPLPTLCPYLHTCSHSFLSPSFTRSFLLLSHPPPPLLFLPQLLRKRHIGNDIVTIIFQEPGALPFTPQNIRSHFQHVFVIVRVHNPCSDGTCYRYGGGDTNSHHGIHYAAVIGRFVDGCFFLPSPQCGCDAYEGRASLRPAHPQRGDVP